MISKKKNKVMGRFAENIKEEVKLRRTSIERR